MVVKASVWYDGSVSKAATQASRLRLILLACVVDKSSSKDKEAIDAIINGGKVSPLVRRHCLCVLMDPNGSEDEKSVAKLFKVSVTPSIYIFHSSGNVVLAGDRLNETQLFSKLLPRINGHGGDDKEDKEYAEIFEKNRQLHEQRQQTLRDLYEANSNESDERHLRAIEAERYRQILIKQRRKDIVHLQKLREDIVSDRQTYAMIHGKAAHVTAVDEIDEPAIRVDKSKVRLLFRLSNGGSKICDFDSHAKFADIRELVESTMGFVQGRSEIALAQPWRVFESSMDTMTLEELGLAPSATLFVRVWNTAPPRAKSKWPQWKSLLAIVVALLAVAVYWYSNRIVWATTTDLAVRK
ncbi:hypothetical protein GGI25_006320 [Coemansia spiralis]|uniref:UBX domain-containing protein n=2 Tax=Coemansia TaxID=4863 RepID=A0A9W8G172_9FUNG|nr:hypothetical protein BX070DRAFT_229045 [Coemansia spiralis]KAJ1986463.1 hypothetical protein EDC05_006281 [Coemansia umbellata]KAJ2618761.1 hypothetical protein GGI26_006362 [Coemansia sp. RSA 1358]KAJ2668906.1 hypothetical protein GGI25_006320 [Coemansia spiralis]